MILPLVFVSVAVALFAVFPLTDTDIWWHLACAREWVTTWTPVREPVVNVHEYFQQTVAFVYNLGGAPLLVAFKAILWGGVFALFLWPSVKAERACHPGLSSRIYSGTGSAIACILLFVFRYQFEMRPVVFSLLFLGVYWNILPWLIIGSGARASRLNCHSGHCAGIGFNVLVAIAILILQWFWCKCQGLYILGLLYAFTVIAFEYELWEGIGWWREKFDYKKYCLHLGFLTLLFVMTFLHYDGFYLFGYPMELFDRLVGFSPSAAVFSSEIAENRSPITLLIAGENVLQSALMIVLVLAGIVLAVFRWYSQKSPYSSWRLTWQRAERMEVIVNYRLQPFCLVVTAALALIAERNFVLFLPVLFAVAFRHWIEWHFAPEDDRPRDARLSSRDSHLAHLLSLILIAFLLGVWVKSLLAYDSMVAYQRVPIAATEWMKSHPHPGRLFNDDRAGGYLAFMNPSDSTYIDGRFMLKTADFFENYLRYSKFPQTFLHDAASQNIDRVVLPLRYYARWDKLLSALDSAKNWHVAYRDSLFVVMDRTER
ncbi:MAG: hypothetical protein IKS97_06005 [Fibrobacter sp.]|nr:hypothetical protein [Fibrobacter sp.]